MKKSIKRYYLSDSKSGYMNFLINKHYAIWMDKFIIPELDYQQNDYIFRKFWADGTIAGFTIKETIGSDLAPEGVAVFCPYAPATYNLYDYPIDVTLVNTRGVKFIPSTLQRVDVDVVLGWCQKNKKSVKEMVMIYIEKLAKIEDVIRTNLNSHRVPWMVLSNPEDKKAIDEMLDQVLQGEEIAYASVDYPDKVKVLLSGNQFIIDKLYDYQRAVEDELREFLGCDNLGVKNKKEHLLVPEIESNNEITEISNDSFKDCLDEFCNRFSETFGYTIHVEEKHQDIKEEEDSEDVREDSETL